MADSRSYTPTNHRSALGRGGPSWLVSTKLSAASNQIVHKFEPANNPTRARGKRNNGTSFRPPFLSEGLSFKGFLALKLVKLRIQLWAF